MKSKLTVRSVEAMKLSSKDVILWDAELAGFGCKLTPAGRRSYFLYYRNKDGQQRRPTIGAHGPLKPEAARLIARTWLAEVMQGRDPSLARAEEKVAPSFDALCDRYLSEHADVRKKASSAEGDRRLIRLHLRPVLGLKKVSSITRADVASLHHKLRATPYEANRVLALASKMFALCERWGMRPDGSNPAKNIDLYKEEKRERYLTSAEVARLWQVLISDAAAVKASPNAIVAVKLLMLTGRRLNEVLGLKWAWVDLDAKMLRLPDTKGGRLTVSLADAAVQIFGDLRKQIEANRAEAQKAGTEWLEPEFVLPSRGASGRLINLQKPWRALRALAGLDDVRLHDLRHTFASIGAGMGLSLHMLGRLLGHTQATTTARYAHLAQTPVQAAADAIGIELMRLTRG